MENRSVVAYILIFLSLALSIYLFVNPNLLVPKGYELAIDGYLISRTLVMIFALYLVSKLGYALLNKKVNSNELTFFMLPRIRFMVTRSLYKRFFYSENKRRSIQIYCMLFCLLLYLLSKFIRINVFTCLLLMQPLINDWNH